MVNRSIFTGNLAKGASTAGSGAILNDVRSSAIIDRSTFAGNQALGFSSFGGALGNYDGSDITVSFSDFNNNFAQGAAGANAGAGGAIECEEFGYIELDTADAALTFVGCSFSGNRVIGSGGAIYAVFNVSVAMTNTTISGNSATNNGGGIVVDGLLTMGNCTVVLNNADADGDGMGSGGGIFATSEPPLLRNTLIAGNKVLGNGGSSNDISSNTTVDAFSSFNLIGDAATSGGLVDNVKGNIVGVGGTGVRDLATIINISLANNGGPTLTHALAAGSPAIDAGSNALVPTGVTTDQRGPGFSRIVNNTVDIGAYESPIFTTTALTANPLATTGGTSVMFTATVAPSPGSLGTVNFLDNGIPILGGSNIGVAGGVAVFSTTTLANGAHPVTAVYSGSTGFAGSTSNVQNVVVSSGAAPPKIVGFTPNGGLAAFAGAQHSRIVDLQVSFDQAVQLDANALTLSLHTSNIIYNGVPKPTGLGAVPTLVLSNSTDNKTWTVTFAGQSTELGADAFASLVDGVYDFQVDGARSIPSETPASTWSAVRRPPSTAFSATPATHRHRPAARPASTSKPSSIPATTCRSAARSTTTRATRRSSISTATARSTPATTCNSAAGSTKR